MKSEVSVHELEALASIPETAAGRVLMTVLERERDTEIKHALACVRGGKEELQTLSMRRAAGLDELLDYLAFGARAALERTGR